jgi:hypothetical protein
MARGEYRVTVEWAEFQRNSIGTACHREGCGSGHTDEFGAARLGAYPDLPGFPAVGELTGSRFTFAPTPNKPGWLSATREKPGESGQLIVSFSLKFGELRRTGYRGLGRALPARPRDGQTNFPFWSDDPQETELLIMRLSPQWCLDQAAALLSGQQVKLPGADLGWGDRLDTVDAIVAMLPYGVRSSLRVSTHAALADSFDLSFIDEERPAVSVGHTESAREYQRQATEYLDEHRDDSAGAVRDIVSSLSQQADAIHGRVADSAPRVVTILSDVLAELRKTSGPQVVTSTGEAPGPEDVFRPAHSKTDDLDLRDVDGAAQRMLAEGQDGRDVCATILARYRPDGDPWALVPHLLFLVGLDTALSEAIGQWLTSLPEGGPLNEIPPALSVTPDRIRAILHLVLEQLEAPGFEGLCAVIVSMFGAAMLAPCREEETEINEELARLAKEERLWQARADSIDRWLERGES